MSLHVFQCTQVVDATLEECWDFFSDPRNLSRITPASLDFNILSDLPPRVHPGLMIRYRVRPLLGIPMTWLTEITQVVRPDYFVDEQRVGPYQLWHHEHFFRAIDDRRTEIRDLVHYALMGGLLGNVVNALVVERKLREIFEYRRETIARLWRAPSQDALTAASGSGI